MAKRWSAVTRALWSDAGFLSLTSPEPNAQTLWLYLLTGPHQGPIPGLLPLGVGAIADGLGWGVASVQEALNEIEQAGMASVCERPALIWLPNALRHNQPANPNIIKSWKTHLGELPECPLRDAALSAIADDIRSNMRAAFRKTFAQELKSAAKRAAEVPGNGSLNRLANGSPNHSANHSGMVSERVSKTEKVPPKKASPQLPKNRTTAKPRNGYPNGMANRMANKDQDQDQDIRTPIPLDSSSAEDLALRLRDGIRKVAPQKAKNPRMKVWTKHMADLMKTEQASPEEVAAVIDWTYQLRPGERFSWGDHAHDPKYFKSKYTKIMLGAKRAGALPEKLGVEDFKTKHGRWAMRMYERSLSANTRFDGGYLIANAELEVGMPILDPVAAQQVAAWAEERA